MDIQIVKMGVMYGVKVNGQYVKKLFNSLEPSTSPEPIYAWNNEDEAYKALKFHILYDLKLGEEYLPDYEHKEILIKKFTINK